MKTVVDLAPGLRAYGLSLRREHEIHYVSYVALSNVPPDYTRGRISFLLNSEPVDLDTFNALLKLENFIKGLL